MLGVVTKATGKSYRVDIGSAVSAVLPELAFEGATKRNKPNVQVREMSGKCLMERTHTYLYLAPLHQSTFFVYRITGKFGE